MLRSLLLSTATLAIFAAAGGAQAPLGAFDGQTDVGHPSRAGSASYDPTSQSYAIAGSGQNMWNARDDFHYVWKRLTGNFILSTRARFVGAGVDPHRKIGWTIRPSLATDGAHVTAALHGNGLVSLQFRRATGATTEEMKSRDSIPDPDAVIQLERRDGAYIMSVARFGDTLATQELTGVSLPDTVYVGLFVCAHNDTVVERASFSNVRITIPASRALVPYREFLGSNLEILDVGTGNATIVHRYTGSFQAPNWTPDGKSLIYAQEGHLYRFDLASRAAEVINTGFATHNNNDHVLSFDGRMLGISNSPPEDGGVSIGYTVPVTGGTPTRVTKTGPSYLHGWSPDGRWLVFTGQRNGQFDVYRIPAVGGDEIRLTTAPGLDDGPEYTPDGAYIYFNSARTGRMQIWRMRPDGSDQRQITNDGFNDWFPHVSPDGKWIAYISFTLDVPAEDHPFYKHVLIRLMPIGGGSSRVIAYVYGGQGTINVPSWSPDGTHLAFVSNTGMPATALAAPAAPAAPASPAALAPPTAAAFVPEIAVFAVRDSLDPPAPGGILFVGSSSIRFWSTLATDFPGEPVLNRGFGGSTLPDVTFYAPRIVLPYRPRTIVLYAGDNDIAAGHSPEQVLADYETFARLVHGALPSTRLVFVSIKPSPSRWELADRMREANALIARAIAGDSLATYVDVFTPMLGPSGRPRPELFRADSLHMTPAGYALWRERLAPFVR